MNLILAFVIIFTYTGLCFSQNVGASKKEEQDKKLSQGVDSSNRRQLTDDELLEKFFNKKSNPSKKKKIEKIYFPIFYESMDQPLTQIEVSFDEKPTGIENFKVDAITLMRVLQELVDPAWLLKMDSIKQVCAELSKSNEKADAAKAQPATCWTTIDKISDTDVVIQFIESSLEVRIRVKPQLRSVKIASLTRTSTVVDEISHHPNWFSSILNIGATQNFLSNNPVYENGRDPLKIRFDSATHFGDLLLEGTGRFTEKRSEVQTLDPEFTRETTRFVYDFPSLGLRSQLGDLSYPVTGFQVFQPLAGFSIFSKNSLSSSRTTLPSNQYELNLARPSKVAIYNNEKLIQTIELPAGRHNVRDFPFSTGLNNIKLEIIDDQGRTETKTFSLLLTSQLLKVGEYDISYSMGVPSQEINGVIEYNSSNPTASFSHRYGLFQALTVGANTQFDQNQNISGLEFLFPTKIGYFSLNPAVSTLKDRPSGQAMNFRFSIEDVFSSQRPTSTTTIDLGFLSSDFAALGDLNPVNPAQLKTKIVHSRSVSKVVNLNLGLGYDFNRSTSTSSGDNTYIFSVGSGQRWTNELTTNISFSHSKNSLGTDDFNLSFFLIWSIPTAKQFVTASGNSGSQNRIEWTSYSPGGVGAHRARVNYQTKASEPSYGGDIEYTANRAKFNASHQVTLENIETQPGLPLEKKSVHSTSLQMETAIVIAGGHVALSRSVIDSFIMFTPKKNLRNSDVLVNVQKDGSYPAQTDWLGPAVLAELTSYFYSGNNISLRENQSAVAIPEDNFYVKPTFRSGYQIDIGTDATVYLTTKFIQEDGSPAAMVAAQAVYLDDPKVESVTVFTNRLGQVRSEGFRPGRYRLDFGEFEFESIEFEIPETAEENFEISEIKLKARK